MTNPNDATRLKHLDSALQKINVLDTVTSSNDGKIWYEVVDGVPVLKISHNGQIFEFNAPTPDAKIFTLAGDTVSAGKNQYRLIGFQNALVIHNNALYADDDAEFEVPLGTFAAITQAGKVTGYTLTLTSENAVDFDALESDALFGLSADADALPVTLSGIPTVATSHGTLIYNADDETYRYKASSNSHYFKLKDTSSAMYDYYRAAEGGEEFWFDAYPLAGSTLVDSGYLSMADVRNKNGGLSSVTLTINSASAFNMSNVDDYFALYVEALNSADSSVPTYVKLGDDFQAKSEPFGVSLAATDSGYEFHAAGSTSGFYEDGNTVKYLSKTRNGQSFTITGLSSGFKLSDSLANGGYSILDKSNQVVGTVGSLSGTTAQIKITSMSAFNLTASAIAGAETFSVTLKDRNMADGLNYVLDLGSLAPDTLSTFTKYGTATVGSASYHLNIVDNGARFERDTTVSNDTYKFDYAVSVAPASFDITNLTAQYTAPVVHGNVIYGTGNTPIATIGADKTVTLNSAALNETLPAGQYVAIVGENSAGYSLAFHDDNHGYSHRAQESKEYAEQFYKENSGNAYIYDPPGRWTQGYYQAGASFAYRTSNIIWARLYGLVDGLTLGDNHTFLLDNQIVGRADEITLAGSDTTTLQFSLTSAAIAEGATLSAYNSGDVVCTFITPS